MQHRLSFLWKPALTLQDHTGDVSWISKGLKAKCQMQAQPQIFGDKAWSGLTHANSWGWGGTDFNWARFWQQMGIDQWKMQQLQNMPRGTFAWHPLDKNKKGAIQALDWAGTSLLHRPLSIANVLQSAFVTTLEEGRPAHGGPGPDSSQVRPAELSRCGGLGRVRKRWNGVGEAEEGGPAGRSAWGGRWCQNQHFGFASGISG